MFNKKLLGVGTALFMTGCNWAGNDDEAVKKEIQKQEPKTVTEKVIDIDALGLTGRDDVCSALCGIVEKGGEYTIVGKKEGVNALLRNVGEYSLKVGDVLTNYDGNFVSEVEQGGDYDKVTAVCDCRDRLPEKVVVEKEVVKYVTNTVYVEKPFIQEQEEGLEEVAKVETRQPELPPNPKREDTGITSRKVRPIYNIPKTIYTKMPRVETKKKEFNIYNEAWLGSMWQGLKDFKQLGNCQIGITFWGSCPENVVRLGYNGRTRKLINSREVDQMGNDKFCVYYQQKDYQEDWVERNSYGDVWFDRVLVDNYYELPFYCVSDKPSSGGGPISGGGNNGGGSNIPKENSGPGGTRREPGDSNTDENPGPGGGRVTDGSSSGAGTNSGPGGGRRN